MGVNSLETSQRKKGKLLFKTGLIIMSLAMGEFRLPGRPLTPMWKVSTGLWSKSFTVVKLFRIRLNSLPRPIRIFCFTTTSGLILGKKTKVLGRLSKKRFQRLTGMC